MDSGENSISIINENRAVFFTTQPGLNSGENGNTLNELRYRRNACWDIRLRNKKDKLIDLV